MSQLLCTNEKSLLMTFRLAAMSIALNDLKRAFSVKLILHALSQDGMAYSLGGAAHRIIDVINVEMKI